MEYNKLVRDNVIQAIIASGGNPKWHTAANDAEFWQAAKNKLVEESKEFVISEDPMELGDSLTLIEAIMAFKGWTWQDIMRLKEKKDKEKGTFEKRIILEES